MARNDEGARISLEEYDAAFLAVTAQAYPEEPTKAAACYVLLKKIANFQFYPKPCFEFLRADISAVDGADEMLAELNPTTGRIAAIYISPDSDKPEVLTAIHLDLVEALFVLSALEEGLDAAVAKKMEDEPWFMNVRAIGGEELEAVRQKALLGAS